MVDKFCSVVGNSTLALVATTTHLLLVDLYSKQTTVIEKGRPEYYGISWFSDAENLVLSHSAINNSHLVDVQSYANSEVGYLSFGNIVSESFLSAPHQILCASDERVICTNTGRNSIAVIDFRKPGVFQEKRFSAARWDRLALDSTTGDHVNSLFEKNGELYVILHGHSQGAALAKLSYPDLSIIEVVPVEGRTGLHNIWVTDEGRKVSCHSSIGALVDLSSNEVIWQAGSPVYTRGLAASSDIVLVGESEITGRDLRRTSTSALWVLEAGSFRTLDYLYLGAFGAVNEVRLLNIPDFAHHGQPFRNAHTLLDDNYISRLRASRLESAHRVLVDNTSWVDYDLIYGAPQQLCGGKKHAGPDALCLIVKRPCEQKQGRSIKFQYDVNADNPRAHLSVVIYQGAGGDDHMYAFLMQPDTADRLKLSEWINNGSEWQSVPGSEIFGLPYFGEMEAKITSEYFELYVDQVQKLLRPLDTLPMIEGALGVRWSDSTIGYSVPVF